MSIAKARKKKRTATNEPPAELSTKELAAEFKVGVRAVDGWVRRGAPFDKRRGRRFFDIQDVRKWLAAKGLLPGVRGREGGRVRAQQSKRTAKDAKAAKKDKKAKAADSKEACEMAARAGSGHGGVTPEPAPGDAATGLEAALGRVETVERDLGVGIITALQRRARTEAGPDDFGILGLLKQYKEVLGELRLATKGFLEVQVMRGELVRREDLLDKMARLASMVRASYERFGDELPPALIADLGEKGVEVGDIAAFQRSVHGAAQRAVDGWLRQLSDQVRLTKPE